MAKDKPDTYPGVSDDVKQTLADCYRHCTENPHLAPDHVQLLEDAAAAMRGLVTEHTHPALIPQETP